MKLISVAKKMSAAIHHRSPWMVNLLAGDAVSLIGRSELFIRYARLRRAFLRLLIMGTPEACVPAYFVGKSEEYNVVAGHK